MGMLGPLLNTPSGTDSCCINSSSAPWLRVARRPHPRPEAASVTTRVFALLRVLPGTLVAGRFTRMSVFHYSPTSGPWMRADGGNPLVWKICRYLRWPRVDPSPDAKAKRGRGQRTIARRWSTKRIAFGDQPSTFRMHNLRFFRDFSSVVRQMPGYPMQSRGMAHTPLPQARRPHLCAWQ